MRTADKILVTGGAGFLGSYVLEELHQRGYSNVESPRSKEFDLREQDQVRRAIEALRPQVVIHLAATVGGIGANRDNPGRFFYENAIMGLMLMEESRKGGVEKFVTVGSICSYPKFAPIPFVESDLWNGYPEETNAPYGIAKKLLLVQGQAYKQQYGMNCIYLMPVNLYGPRDNFDLHTSHVIPAMIRKFIDARDKGLKEVVFWGDGSPTREFLYVSEAARGIVMAAETYDEEHPVNLGSGKEISIKELAGLVAQHTQFSGTIIWDSNQPNGQARRRLNVEVAREKFGFVSSVSFDEGIKRTIDWYMAHRAEKPVLRT